MGGRAKKSKKPSATKAEQLLEETTFIVDECLGKGVAEKLRAVGLKAEWSKDHFPEGTEDEAWLPVVGERGWVSLNKDKELRRKPWEIEKILRYQVKVFTLSSGNMTGDEMAEVFIANRHKMARTLKEHRGAFVAVISKSGVEVLKSSKAGADKADETQSE